MDTLRLAMESSRIPYIVLLPGSFLAYHGIAQAAEAYAGTSNFVHSTGLFFFSGVAAGDCLACTNPITRKTYFLLHLTMPLFISIICLANRKTLWGVRRVFHFAWAYLAVGIAVPLQFAVTGDTDLFRPWSLEDDYGHSTSGRSPVDDADFDTYATLFINAGWMLLSFFPLATCSDEYRTPAATTMFDYTTIVWAGLAMLPLLLYSWRSLLPRFWATFGYRRAGSGYRGLAKWNGFIIAVFGVRELLVTLNQDLAARDHFFTMLQPFQQEAYDWDVLAAVVDYAFTAVTMAVLAYRCDPKPSIRLALTVLVLPPVGFPLVLEKIRSSQAVDEKKI